MQFFTILGIIFVALFVCGIISLSIAAVIAVFRPVLKAVRRNRNYTSMTQRFYLWNVPPTARELRSMDFRERMYVKLLAKKRKRLH